MSTTTTDLIGGKQVVQVCVLSRPGGLAILDVPGFRYPGNRIVVLSGPMIMAEWRLQA